MNTRFHWVDALRGASAFVIVVFHYHHFYMADAFDRGSVPAIEDLPYAVVLAPFYGIVAIHAVKLFWLISGFVFAHVYLARRATAWEFGVARFARLYPLHFATLIYVAALQLVSLWMAGHWHIYFNNDLKHFLLQLVMASNWTNLSEGLSFNGPIWSVSLEILVYVIFFVSLFALRRSPFWVSLALCAACFGFVAFQPFHLPLIRLSVLSCAGYFFLGTLLYAMKPFASTGWALGLSALSALGFGLGLAWELELLMVGGASVALVALAVALDRAAPAFGARLSALGDISYSLYLVHIPLQLTVLVLADLLWDGARGFAEHPLTLPVYVVISALLAHLAYRRFELPAGRMLRARLLPRKR